MTKSRLGGLAFLVAMLGGAFALEGCSSVEADVASGDSAQTEAKGDPRTREIKVSGREREAVVQDIATKKATCPFVGAAVAMESAIQKLQRAVPGLSALKLLNTPSEPLAPIVGDGSIEALGNTGDVRVGKSPKPSTLGYVIAGFALGNHGVIPQTGEKVPTNTFSLDFPGSKGSHPGHSFILQGDPTKPGTGAFSERDLERLIGPRPSSLACPAESGASAQGKMDPGGHAEAVTVAGKRVLVVRRSEIGKFIAENVFRDPNAKAGGKNAAFWRLGQDSIELGHQLASDLSDVVTRADALRSAKAGDDAHVELLEQHRGLATKLTTLLGEDNLIGGAGEYALLLTFLQNSPNTVDRDGLNPGYAVEELTLMFKGDASGRRLPDGWHTWNKDALVWAANTTALLTVAAAHYHLALRPICR
jgi:hypothetical protein